MSAEVPSPTPRAKSARKPFTPEVARDELFAKLEKAGAKGTASLIPLKTPPEKRAVYEQVLSEMERAREVFADREIAKTKYFLWSLRPQFSPEEARAEMQAKLEKGGTKGVTTLFPAKLPRYKREVYDHVLAEMERGRELYADRRTDQAKYYLWPLRPQPPSRESVAAQLEDYLLSRHPMLVGITELKKAIGKSKEAAQYLFSAFELLAANRKLVILRHKKGKTYEELYAHAGSLRQMLGVEPAATGDPDAPPALAAASQPGTDFEPERVRRAYADIVKQTGFPAVPISALQSQSGVLLSALKSWIKEQYANGSAVLSFGDWSLADDAKRAAAVELNGERYLLVRLVA
jgi:hypothetical protein